MSIIIVGLIILVNILILVLIHEWGHYIMAKRFHIKVLEFGFGLPPRLFGKKFGETLYSINWLPLGGFVRLLGEDEPGPETKHPEKSRYFSERPVWQRIVVVIAGVFMNLILSWILFWIFLGLSGFRVQIPLQDNHHFFGVDQRDESIVVINGVAPNSPAQAAGIKNSERIIALNDKFISTGSEFISLTRAHAGEKIKLTLSDLEQKNYRKVELVPRQNPPTGQGALGISLGSFRVANLEYNSLLQKILSGPIHSFNIGSYSMEILGKSIGTFVTKRNINPLASNVGGPVAVAYTTSSILKYGTYLDFINLMAGLSLSLAIFNFLPIPGLDGGRLLFLYIEGLTKKRVPAKLEGRIHLAGLALLIVLIIAVTYKDIRFYAF